MRILTGLFGTDGSGCLGSNHLQTDVPLDAAAVTNAKYLLGERAQSMSVMAIHPNVAYDLELLGMRSMADGAGGGVSIASNGIGISQTEIRLFAGMRIIIDEQIKPVNGRYPCYMFAPGVVRTGSQFPLQIETERSPRSLQDAFYVTYNNCTHVLGTSWYAVEDNPSTTCDRCSPLTVMELLEPSGQPDNWKVAYSDPRTIPLVRVDVVPTLKVGTLTRMGAGEVSQPLHASAWQFNSI